MLYDLSINWATDLQPSVPAATLQRTLSFVSELNYSAVALDHTINSVPTKIVNPIPQTLPFPTPKDLNILRRCTLAFADPALNHRLPSLVAAYDILALRPTTEKAFLAACTSLSDHSLISLDLTSRFPFHFRPKPLMAAVKRGIRFEICYAQATQADSHGRRNFITNVLSIVRATSGRGLVVSSGARSATGIRAPADVGNLMTVWGVSTDRALEAVTVVPRSVLINERMKRTSYRGVVDVINGGEMPVIHEAGEGKKGQSKRKNDNREQGPEETPVLSKRAAKRLRLEAMKAKASNSIVAGSEKKDPSSISEA